MIPKHTLLAAGMMAGFFASEATVFGQEKKEKGSKPAAQEEMTAPEDAMSEKDKPAAKVEKQASAKVYQFKGAKKAGTDGPVVALRLTDALTGKNETLNVATSDPAAGKAEPLPAVADAAKALSPGDIIEVKTERQRGRLVAVEVAKAELVPGEERPKGFVFVGWDRQKTGDGDKVMGLKLRKFGREIVVMVPLKKNNATGDWNPPGQVDYILNRVQPGEAIEATIKPGNPPVLEEIFEYYPPERGKFVEFTQTEDNGIVSAAFKMTSGNDTLTISLPGVEKQKGVTKYIMPDAKQLSTIRGLKPDTEIEVYTRGRNDYVLREIKVVAPSASGKSDAKTDQKPGAKKG